MAHRDAVDELLIRVAQVRRPVLDPDDLLAVQFVMLPVITVFGEVVQRLTARQRAEAVSRLRPGLQVEQAALVVPARHLKGDFWAEHATLIVVLGELDTDNAARPEFDVRDLAAKLADMPACRHTAQGDDLLAALALDSVDVDVCVPRGARIALVVRLLFVHRVAGLAQDCQRDFQRFRCFAVEFVSEP